MPKIPAQVSTTIAPIICFFLPFSEYKKSFKYVSILMWWLLNHAVTFLNSHLSLSYLTAWITKDFFHCCQLPIDGTCCFASESFPLHRPYDFSFHWERLQSISLSVFRLGRLSVMFWVRDHLCLGHCMYVCGGGGEKGSPQQWLLLILCSNRLFKPQLAVCSPLIQSVCRYFPLQFRRHRIVSTVLVERYSRARLLSLCCLLKIHAFFIFMPYVSGVVFLYTHMMSSTLVFL